MRKTEETLTKIREHLKTLKLNGIQKVLEQELADAAQQALPPTELLERLLAIEANAFIERKIERKIRESRLPERKLLSDFDFVFQTGIDKAQVMELAKLDFVGRKQGLVLAGNSGTGKSYIAKALLLIGCTKQYSCRYTTAADMLTDLMASRADNSFHRKLRQYISPDILLIDELGFDRLEQQDAKNASLFFKVIDGRYCKNSTLLTTNVDFKDLGDYLGDPVVTTAIVDRMVHHSIILNIEGPSWRMHESKKLNTQTRKAKTKT
ncbi:MAG TPA: IS21-like element helper ATPase IstB [Dissulfurispiraceae bacterium]|nr:IS21-like element helper ATPase IstB [Dissulfurispiraceae bacterium]